MTRGSLALIPWAVAVALGVMTYIDHQRSQADLVEMCTGFWVSVCGDYGIPQPSTRRGDLK